MVRIQIKSNKPAISIWNTGSAYRGKGMSVSARATCKQTMVIFFLLHLYKQIENSRASEKNKTKNQNQNKY